MSKFILVINLDESIGNIIPLDDTGLLAIEFNCRTQIVSRIFKTIEDCRYHCYHELHLRSVEDWSI